MDTFIASPNTSDLTLFKHSNVRVEDAYMVGLFAFSIYYYFLKHCCYFNKWTHIIDNVLHKNRKTRETSSRCVEKLYIARASILVDLWIFRIIYLLRCLCSFGHLCAVITRTILQLVSCKIVFYACTTPHATPINMRCRAAFFFIALNGLSCFSDCEQEC